jgi:hypothetical protein
VYPGISRLKSSPGAKYVPGGAGGRGGDGSGGGGDMREIWRGSGFAAANPANLGFKNEKIKKICGRMWVKLSSLCANVTCA